MVTAASIGVSVKTLFIVLFCVLTASFAHLFIFGDYISCFDIHSRWLILITADFTSFAVVIGAWISYKESSWIVAVVLVSTMYLFGSLVSLGYILTQFYKLSHEEYVKDPLYFVLARRQKRDVSGGSSVVAARVIFSVLGCLVLGVLIYTLILELSPSYIKYFASCFVTTAIDMNIYVVTFSVWIAYKESSWASALFWIVLLVCFRGVALCAYLVLELSYLSPHQPASLIILNATNRETSVVQPSNSFNSLLWNT
ncbi:hypothetical protein HanRHA438_Chr15g0718631 [Helianthus annuus]|uniref:Transmembrane protein n=1 Tax=Helianthus annuus TaxID=4232 RepID=A0A9K3E431_HELAN|nr:uncharacterized protein LOC110912066 isoform X1 [Helianthus annuus]KAF5765668.1 hypothetical protein HanXRQr2_Chr15g0706451 [Helianthus annuus]KAJ0832372.1 hypothetical protein HanPSC8_Chr15g0678041 [Helianthus annuus]KAJ0845880.1 hypothetical protein HanRHA438_Chr15g0718631 [Helianthus annuus]